MKAIVCVAALLLAPITLHAQEIDEGAIQARSTQVIELLSANDLEGLRELWSPTIMDQLTPEQVLTAWGTVSAALGAPVEIPDSEITRDGDVWVASSTLPFAATGLPVTLAFAADGLVVGVRMGG